MAAMQAPCCTSGCSVTLRLRDGKTLAVPRCALAAASPVLREVLSLRLAPPGELELPDDDLDTWQAALKVLVPTRFVKYLANWVGSFRGRAWNPPHIYASGSSRGQ